jgi:hypothetical protein
MRKAMVEMEIRLQDEFRRKEAEIMANKDDEINQLQILLANKTTEMYKRTTELEVAKTKDVLTIADLEKKVNMLSNQRKLDMLQKHHEDEERKNAVKKRM